MIDDCCFKTWRSLVLDFMTSPAGRKAWASVFDNVADEIDLARRLAPVLPIANRDEFSKLIELIHDLQSIWIERGAKITEAEQEARWAGAALLWNMSRVWMRQSKTYTFPSPIKDDESRLVQVLSCAATESLVKEAEIYREPVIANGAKLFSEIVQFSDGKTPEAEISGLTKPSKGKLFIDELEVSVRSFLCFMPPAYDTDTEKTSTVVDHFEATQRIAFYRATANLAAKIAVAAKAVRPNLGFAGETTAKDVAQAAVRALLVSPLCNTRPGEQSLTTFLPLRQSSVPVDDNRIEKTQHGKTARRAYAVLAGEALLLAIHFCESYLTSVNAILPWQDRILRDQVRALTKSLAALMTTLGTPLKRSLTRQRRSASLELSECSSSWALTFLLRDGSSNLHPSPSMSRPKAPVMTASDVTATSPRSRRSKFAVSQGPAPSRKTIRLGHAALFAVCC